MDELRESLALASDEERQALVELLFRPKFNPLDYIRSTSVEAVQGLPWAEQIDAIEMRFRFLAADGLTVIRGETTDLSYRTVLLQTGRYLKLEAFTSLSNDDLEAEIFLSLLQRTWQQLPDPDRAALTRDIQQALRHQGGDRPLGHLLEVNGVRLFLEGSTALAVTAALRPWILQLIAQQFTQYWAKRQLARLAVQQGGSVVAKLQGYAAARLASRGMAVSAARYGAARSLLGFLGPALWAWFAADLGWRAIATNYARVVPAIFILAQIRLTRLDYSTTSP